MVLDIVEEKKDSTKVVVSVLLFIGLLLIVLFNERTSFYAIMGFSFIFSLMQAIEGFSIRQLGVFTIDEKVCELQRGPGEIIRYDYKDIKCVLIDHYRYMTGMFSTTQKAIMKITIQQAEQEISFTVLIRSKKVKEEFKATLKKLYENNVCIREYDMNGTRSFLFRSNLSYNEIQNIKQEYNISWH